MSRYEIVRNNLEDELNDLEDRITEILESSDPSQPISRTLELATEIADIMNQYRKTEQHLAIVDSQGEC